eukprot:6732620-Pyramimonas_sp.AAC.1
MARRERHVVRGWVPHHHESHVEREAVWIRELREIDRGGVGLDEVRLWVVREKERHRDERWR